MKSFRNKSSRTLKALKEAANALDMELVYGLVPKDGSLDGLIERKAKKLAIEIVKRTSSSMELEDQVNTEKRLRKAVTERTAILLPAGQGLFQIVAEMFPYFQGNEIPDFGKDNLWFLQTVLKKLIMRLVIS